MKDIMLLDGGIGQELVKRNLSTKILYGRLEFF